MSYYGLSTGKYAKTSRNLRRDDITIYSIVSRMRERARERERERESPCLEKEILINDRHTYIGLITLDIPNFFNLSPPPLQIYLPSLTSTIDTQWEDQDLVNTAQE